MTRMECPAAHPAAQRGTVVMKHDDVRGTDDRYYGPGHFGLYSEGGADYVTFHYYDPNGYYPNPAVNNRGGPTLGLARLVWGDDGWPSVSLILWRKAFIPFRISIAGK